MKFRYLLFTLSLFTLSTQHLQAQMVGDCIFFKGKHVEIGIAPNGAYGSTVDAPTGYHNNITQTFYDPATAVTATVNTLGFVADPDLDGWNVGTPNYFGDYYMPGTPQEGWAIQANGDVENAYMTNYAYGMTGYTLGSGISFFGASGSLTGYSPSGSGTLSYSVAGTVLSGVWKGTMGNLQIKQTTQLDTNKLYFTVAVEMKNTGGTDLPGVYYLRTVDPDNDEVESTDGDYTTDNSITYSLPNPENKVLVSANGHDFPRAYLGLGTKDCRAVAMILTGGLAPDDDSLSQLWNGTAPDAQYSGVDTNDIGIGLVYNLGTIAAGDSTILKYAYILRQADLDSALDATSASFLIDSVPYAAVDTIDACNIGKDTVTININGGAYYHWHWEPATGLSDTVGTSSVLTLTGIPAGTVYTVTGTTTGGGCLTQTLKITVKRDVVTTTAHNNTPICAGDTILLSADSVRDMSFTWTGPDGFRSSLRNPDIANATTANAGVYSVTVNVPGCLPSTATTTAVVNPLPDPPVVTTPVYYCQFDVASPLTAAGTALEWFTDPNSGTGSPTAPTPPTTIPNTQYYYVDQTVSGCTSYKARIKVQISQKPIAGFTDIVNIGCTYDTAIFNNTSQFGETYAWSFGDTLFAAPDSLINPAHYYVPQFFNDTSYTVTLYVFNGGCSDTTTGTVHLNVTPGITLTNITPNQTIAFGNHILLNAEGAYYYYWTPDDGSLDNANIHNPIATPRDSTIYMVHGYSKDGCADSAQVSIGVINSAPEVVPNAFSPNGDGLNDLFRVSNIQYGKLLDMRVFNRWGQEIYHSTDANAAWDGTYKGTPQDIGDYEYMIIVSHNDGTTKYYKGNVTLLR